MRIAKLILSTLFTICILGLVAGGVLYFHLKSSLPSVESLKTVELQQPMQIYTADGKLIGEVGEQRRIPVKLENVPQRLQDAFLATEDSRFYDHHGLDPVGIARAIFVAVNNGGASQGASTITQQLARNFFLTPEKTIIRKAREAVLAIEIENALSKQEILELATIFSEMVQGQKDERQDQLGDAAFLSGVAKFPQRIKCATLAWNALKKTIENQENQ